MFHVIYHCNRIPFYLIKLKLNTLSREKIYVDTAILHYNNKRKKCSVSAYIYKHNEHTKLTVSSVSSGHYKKITKTKCSRFDVSQFSLLYLPFYNFQMKITIKCLMFFHIDRSCHNGLVK